MASAVTVRAGYAKDDAENYEAVVFLDEESGEAIEFQRTLIPDEQDKVLGHDTYCIVLSSGPSFYGGVTRWSVDGGLITFVLDDVAAASLGVRREISMSTEEGELDAVVGKLEAIIH